MPKTASFPIGLVELSAWRTDHPNGELLPHEIEPKRINNELAELIENCKAHIARLAKENRNKPLYYKHTPTYQK